MTCLKFPHTTKTHSLSPASQTRASRVMELSGTTYVNKVLIHWIKDSRDLTKSAK